MKRAASGEKGLDLRSDPAPFLLAFGVSAESLEALRTILHQLPTDIPLLLPPDNHHAVQYFKEQIAAAQNSSNGNWKVVRRQQQPRKKEAVKAAIPKAQQKLADMLQLARIGCWEYDFETSVFRFDTDINVVLPELSGKILSRNEFYTLFRDHINIRAIDKAILACTGKGESFDLELQLSDQFGKDRWLRVVGRCVTGEGKKRFLSGYLQDISNSKTAQSDLKLFTKMFEQSPSPIIVTDTQGIIEYVNPVFCRLSGYKPEEAVGRTPAFLRWPEANKQIYSAIWKTILGGKIWNGTLKNMKKNGDPFWVSASIAPLKNDLGEIINFISIQENITDRIMLEQEIKLERINNQKKITDSIIVAQEKERIEIGQELHDNINQMLASAKIFLSTIHKDDPIIVKVEDILSEAINEVRRMSHSLVVPSDFNISLKDLINTIIVEFNDLGQLNIHTNFDHFNEFEIPQNMKLNIYRIFQIQFSNIYRHAEATNVWINLERKDRKIRLEIRDDGVGFDTHIRTTGIGLMNLRTRAALFDGKVLIDSAPGKGCRVVAEMDL